MLLTCAPGICGTLYYHSGDDIAGFQNRMGVFFFTLALFGFSCLSSLSLFANERLLFMRERCVAFRNYFVNLIVFAGRTVTIRLLRTSPRRLALA